MRSEDKTRLLGTAPIGPLYLKLAFPAVLGQMAVLLNNVIDRIWVGHIPGDGMLSLGAVGLSLPIHHVLLAFILMLASGMGPAVSILLGRGERGKAAAVSGACFGLAMAVNVISMAVLLVFADGLLMAFGAGQESLPFARSYLRTLAWGMPFSNTLLMLTMWLSAQGYVSDGVRLNLVNVGVNAALDPLFIFPLGMGVTGAALATNAGGIVALGYGIFRVARNENLPKFGLRDMLPRPSVFRKPVMLGLSTLLNVGMESIALLLLNASLQKYGGDRAVATMALFGVPLLILMNICLGLANGAQPIISFNYGKGAPDRVRQINRLFVLAAFVCSTALWASVMAFPQAFWRCFSSDAGLIGSAAGRTRLFFAVALFGGIQYAHIYIIKFLGQVKMSLFLGVLKRLVLLVPLMYILPAALGGDKVNAVLLASPVSEGLAFLVTAVCYLTVMKNLKARGEK